MDSLALARRLRSASAGDAIASMAEAESASVRRGTKRARDGMAEFRALCEQMTPKQLASVVDCREHLAPNGKAVDAALAGTVLAGVDDLTQHITSMVTPCIPSPAVLKEIYMASRQHRITKLAEEIGEAALAAAIEGDSDYVRFALKDLANYAPWVETAQGRSMLTKALSSAGQVNIGDHWKYNGEYPFDMGEDDEGFPYEYREKAIWLRFIVPDKTA